MADGDAFREWLASIRLHDHEEQLRGLGFADMEFLRGLDEEGLADLRAELKEGGVPGGVVMRFVAALRQLSTAAGSAVNAARSLAAGAESGGATATVAEQFQLAADDEATTQVAVPSAAAAAPAAAAAAPRFCPRCRDDRAAEDEQCTTCGSATLNLPLALSCMNEGIAVGYLVNRRFRVAQRLGAGGMGEVWLAQDGHLDLPRVVKTIKAADPNVLKQLILRFRHEAIYGAEINHPNVAKVFEYQQTPQGLIYLVMEFVEGRNLLQVLKQDGPASAEFVFGVLLQALDGLDALHAANIVHRDIKLENLMWSTAAGQLKIVDCGIAKRERDPAADEDDEDDQQAGATTITRAGVRGPASPAYAPPEYWRELPADRRSDLYSLAIAAFQLLTGELPFKARNTADLMVAIVSDPLPLERLPADADGVLRDAIVRAAAKDPEERFQTAAEFKGFLEAGRSRQEEAAAVGGSGELAAAQERAEAAEREREALQGRLAELEADARAKQEAEARAKEQQEAEEQAAAASAEAEAEQARLAEAEAEARATQEAEARAKQQQEAAEQALPVSDVAKISVDRDCDRGRKKLRLLAAHRFPGLVKLWLWGMHELGQEIVEVVTAAMREGRLPALQKLSLFNNSIGDAEATAVAAALGQVPGLQKFDLSANSIGDAGATAVAAALGQVPGLQELALAGNSIGEAGATAVAAALGQVPGLQKLYLQRNNIGDKEGIERQVRAVLPNIQDVFV